MNVKIKLNDGTIHEFYDAYVLTTVNYVHVNQRAEDGCWETVLDVRHTSLKKLTIKP